MKKINGQSGFTLIEIVMVLVLLGILAAVAVPKYYDLQEEALKQSAKAVAAEYQARLNGRFAEAMLNDLGCTEAVKDAIAEVKKLEGQQTPAAAHGFTLSSDLASGQAPKADTATLTLQHSGLTKDVTVTIGVPVCGAEFKAHQAVP